MEPTLTDYETYKAIMEDLLRPIMANGLDMDTLMRLYESKTIYLEKLRLKCFWEINTKNNSHFHEHDYVLILQAIKDTKAQIRNLILLSVTNNLANRKAS